MTLLARTVAAVALLLCLPFTRAQASHVMESHAAEEHPPAPAPPMGWNSWDAWGFTINEQQFKDSVRVLAQKLRPQGWDTAVIDEGWYFEHPAEKDPETLGWVLDANGRYAPDPARFPSAQEGEGLKPLADWVHGLGLKFGIHIVRGIPRKAVRENLPVESSAYHAQDVADTADACPWDSNNWGVRDDDAGQAYYDSLIALYARWGVDFLKVDCIADHPYQSTEIRMIYDAIRKAKRPMVLSLSPGPTSVTHAAEVKKWSQMWRINDDTWDQWTTETGKTFPMGVLQAFDKLAEWAPYASADNWPDADMLPVGSLKPSPGWGSPRESRLTEDEQQTMVTLWSIARSPLIFGGNLLTLDEATLRLLTNPEVIQVNQHAVGAHQAMHEGALRVWVSQAAHRSQTYVAVFNTGDTALPVELKWKSLGLEVVKNSEVRDLWQKKNLGPIKKLKGTVRPHASWLVEVTSAQ